MRTVSEVQTSSDYKRGKRCIEILFLVEWLFIGVGRYIKETAYRLLERNLAEIMLTLFFSVAIVLVILLSKKYIEQHISYRVEIFIIIYILLVFFHYLIYSENRKYVVEYFGTMYSIGILFVLFGATIEFDARFTKKLVCVSTMVVIVNVLYYTYAILKGETWKNDNMSLVSGLLPSACMLIGWFQKKKKRILSILVLVFTVLMSILWGSRAGIICVLVFYCLLMIRQIKRKVLFFIIFAAIIFFVYFNIESFIELLISVMTHFKGSGRIIFMLKTGDFFSNDSRSLLAQKIIAAIKQRPLFGWGIFGDRVILGDDKYVHNIVLEMICDFGVLNGIIIAYTIIQKTIKRYLISNKVDEQIMICIVISFIVKLMVSGSYLSSEFFFLLIGMILTSGKIR